ncbi:MAG: hypothetical protein NTV19_12195 [Burkholderiales bacterium]|nr:hypothetical protein [Burkholderiales bacterium]
MQPNQPRVPLDDLRVVLHGQVTHRAPARHGAGGRFAAGFGAANQQRTFDLAQGERHGGRAVEFDDAEGRGGELGQRRIGRGPALQRKEVGIDQWPLIGVAQVARQDHGEIGRLGLRALERHRVDGCVAAVVDDRFAFAIAKAQPDRLGGGARNRRGELDPHLAQRRARGAAVLARA